MTLTADVKTCSRCNEIKELNLFSKNKRTKDGYRYVCKACTVLDYSKNSSKIKEKRKIHYNANKTIYQERSYSWREQNPEKRQLSEKKRQLKKKYNLDWNTYLELFEKQNGTCAICNIPLALFPHEHFPSACVDHDHATGKIRGLLCYSCNLVLGYARDNVVILDSAKKYLNGNSN